MILCITINICNQFSISVIVIIDFEILIETTKVNRSFNIKNMCFGMNLETCHQEDRY